MAIRFQSIFPSERDTEITLNIHDSEYVGSIIPFNSDSQGYRLTYSEAGSEQTQRFMSTQCEVVFRVEDETQFLLITDFLESQEGRFLISIEEDAALVWVGVVLPDVTKYDESPFPINFTLKATDGVGALKDVPFKNGSSFYTGKARIIEFITRALSKIVHVSEFYTTGDIFVRSSVDWWEENMTHVSDGSDMLYQAYLDNAVYYTFDKGAQDVKSCYDVLNDILTSLGMRLTFARGAFHIEQLPYRVSDIIIQRNYGPDGAFISAVNYNDQNLIDQTAQGALIATGEYEFTAPISKAEHKFAALERRNFFAGAQNIDDTHTGIDTFYIPIQSNGNNTTLRITGSLVLRISSNISAPGYTAPLDPFFAVIRMNLFLDTVGLQRTYTAFQTFQFVYETATWNATPGCYFIQPIGGVFLANTTDDIFTFTQTIDLITPPLTESTDSFTCTWSLESLKNYDGTTVTNWATDFNTTYEISNLWLEAYSNGGPVLSGDGDIYYTNNSETQNTLVWKTEGLIGSSTNPNTVGAIWVKPASTYILAELWGAGSDTPAFSFVGQMLTRDIAKTHAKPARKLNGTLYGDIVSVSRVVWQSENWILLGGTWNAVNNLFSGTWIEMKTVSGLTPSNPIKFVAWPDPEPPNTSTETPGVDGPFMVGAPHGSVWYAIASTLSDESIRAGTPGTIDIQDTLSDYDFNAGDTVAIINPLSGVFETLLVTNTTTNGQTALTVTGSIVGTYPAGSPIVRIPRIGGPFSLPGGVAGQIMRHDGTKWAAYGTTALADGVVLTWTDAGGWAAAAIPAATASKWTDAANYTYLTATTDRVLVGSSTELNTGYIFQANGGIYTSGLTRLHANQDAAGLTIRQHSTQTTPLLQMEYSNGAIAGYAHIFNLVSRSTVFGVVGSVGATSTNNLVFGYAPNLALTNGNGDNALFNNGGVSGNNGYQNSFFGIYSGINNLDGFQNSAIGYQALEKNESGYQNMAIGRQAMRFCVSGSTNIGIGANSLRSATAPFQVVSIGEAAAVDATTAENSVVIGQGAASQKTSISGAVVIGQNVARGVGTITDQLWIDNSNTTTPLISGNFSNDRLGVNTPHSSLAQTLHVTGTVRITGSDGTATALMGRDADGDISAVSLGSTLSITAGTLNATNQTITLSGDVTGSGSTAITTTIANNAVTVAKMAQLAGLSILGRSANSTGNMAAITASVALSYLRLNAGGTALEWGTLPASGTLTGNGVATRIPVYNGTTSFTNIAGFNFDTTNFRLQISEQVTPDATAATLNVDYGTITGSRAWLDVDGSLSTNLTATIRNFRNVGNSGDNIFSLVTGGASGGDPILQFIISGVETWSIGVDNTDADKLKIKPQASPGAGASGGEGITMTTAVTPLVGINTDTPAHPLDVNGFARALTYTSRTDTTGGTVTFGTGAGSGPSLFAVVLPNGNMCTVRWTQGTSGTAGGRVLNIAIPTVLRHASKIYVTFSANNDLTARDIAKFSIDYSGTTPGSIALKSNALLTALDDGGDYFLTMHITGHA